MAGNMLPLFGIFLSLGLLMYLAYRGITVLILAPLLALLAVLFSGDAESLLAVYTNVFMTSLGKYIVSFFPLFLLGAIFGKLMDDSGSAKSIAHVLVKYLGHSQAIMAIVLACGILTYGGVSLFVVGFAVYPIAASLFREMDLPKRLIPGAIALGALTFTMTALPGTPAIQNTIPIKYFGTDAFAAPGLGTIGGLIMFVGGMLWLNLRAKRAKARGEGYGVHTLKEDVAEQIGSLPSFFMAIVPILFVIVSNFSLTKHILPAMTHDYLNDPRFEGLKVESMIGIWSIILALFLACLLLIALNWSRWKNLKETVNDGTMGSLLPIFNTASEVGYGAVIASLAAFVIVRDFLMGISPGNPLISEAIVVNVLAGITGSASGGMSIALETMGATYLELARTVGIDPQVLHRIASMASGGLDTLPHNGAVVTLLAVCGLTHRQSYADIFVVAVAIPVVATAVVITLATMFGSF